MKMKTKQFIHKTAFTANSIVLTEREDYAQNPARVIVGPIELFSFFFLNISTNINLFKLMNLIYSCHSHSEWNTVVD